MYMAFKLKRIHLKGQIKITLVGKRLMFLFYRKNFSNDASPISLKSW